MSGGPFDQRRDLDGVRLRPRGTDSVAADEGTDLTVEHARFVLAWRLPLARTLRTVGMQEIRLSKACAAVWTSTQESSRRVRAVMVGVRMAAVAFRRPGRRPPVAPGRLLVCDAAGLRVSGRGRLRRERRGPRGAGAPEAGFHERLDRLERPDFLEGRPADGRRIAAWRRDLVVDRHARSLATPPSAARLGLQPPRARRRGTRPGQPWTSPAHGSRTRSPRRCAAWHWPRSRGPSGSAAPVDGQVEQAKLHVPRRTGESRVRANVAVGQRDRVSLG